MASQRKISHYRRIILEQKVPEKSILPGMILSFGYNVTGVYDRRPLLFFMYKDGDKIHGMNLNYLHEVRIQKFFSLSQALIPLMEENLIHLPKDYLRLQLSTSRRATSVDAQLLYTMVFSRDVYYKNAYRTYLLSKATAMKVVNYNVDVISKLKAGKKQSVESIKQKAKEEE